MVTQYLNQLEGKIAYDRTGSGPLIVAIPGMGDLRAEYRFLTPQLIAGGYQVVTMDLRGQGESSTRWPDFSVAGIGQDILGLIRSLDAGPAIVIGESMAAGAAVWAAVEAPELVRALVLLGPAVRGELSRSLRILLGVLFARPWGPSAWIMYFNKLFPSRKPVDFADYTAALQRNLREPGRVEALRRMMVASKASSEARLGQVAAPTLLLMGTKDPDFKDPEAEVKSIAGRMSGTYQMVAGAGHYPHVEMPEIAGPRILEFLKTLQPEGAHVATTQP